MPTTSEYLCCKELDICVDVLKEARMVNETRPVVVLVISM